MFSTESGCLISFVEQKPVKRNPYSEDILFYTSLITISIGRDYKTFDEYLDIVIHNIFIILLDIKASHYPGICIHDREKLEKIDFYLRPYIFFYEAEFVNKNIIHDTMNFSTIHDIIHIRDLKSFITTRLQTSYQILYNQALSSPVFIYQKEIAEMNFEEYMKTNLKANALLYIGVDYNLLCTKEELFLNVSSIGPIYNRFMKSERDIIETKNGVKNHRKKDIFINSNLFTGRRFIIIHIDKLFHH